MEEEYTEEIFEAVAHNIGYLDAEVVYEVATFLEAVSESLYDGEKLVQVAAAMRDAVDGETF